MQEINTGIVINNFMFYELGQSDFWEALGLLSRAKYHKHSNHRADEVVRKLAFHWLFLYAQTK